VASEQALGRSEEQAMADAKGNSWVRTFWHAARSVCRTGGIRKQENAHENKAVL
jgi:hypothetical protein